MRKKEGQAGTNRDRREIDSPNYRVKEKQKNKQKYRK
jgi:hypothetical protein